MPPPLLPRAVHGGPQSADEAILDFSVNANPLGPNPELVRIWREADVSGYPDPHYRRARKALAAFHGCSPEGVVPGIGASELLHRIVRAFVSPGDLVVSLGAPFGEFARAAALHGARLEVAARDLMAAPTDARLVYLSNPHNPTGHCLDLRTLPPKPLFIVDEAYRPFVEHRDEPPLHPNLIRLQSPGKAHGVLGMRLAYALADPDIAAHLTNLEPAWAFPSAHAAALAALPEQTRFLEDTLPTVRQWANELASALGAASTGLHFFTLNVPDAGRVAADLLRHGLRVRDCTSFGHPNLIRVATRRPEDNQILIEVWKELYG
ncbi:MAG: histidinol-phosphate transaminase [Anaerolineales bacterium]|nr:histidinol-phosphate transaminase [Anaerolineales bacterium]